jgi:hypothetical protein
MPAKLVVSVGGTQTVPPGEYTAGQEAGGAIATLSKKAAVTAGMFASQELFWSLARPPPRFILDVSAPPKARLFLRIPTEMDDVLSLPTPSMLKSGLLLYAVLL